MHRRCIIFPTAAISLIVFFLLVFFGCETKNEGREPVMVWENYLKAVREGQKELAKSLFTKESQVIFEFDPHIQDFFKNSEFTIIKESDNEDFIELQILAEKEGKQTGLFQYIVKQDDKYLLQYPFLIFAADWPTKESEHFILHRQSFIEDMFGEEIKDSTVIDLNVLDTFLAKIKNQTGSTYAKRIDYYFCETEKDVEKLSGVRGALWTNIGSCVISSKRYDFAEITKILTRSDKGPIDFLYYGIWGYAELERARVEGANWNNVDFTTAKHFEKLGEHPILSLLEEKNIGDKGERQRDMFSVGGALIDYLVEKYGANKFRTLYQNSWTPEEFQNQLSTIYNIDLQSVEGQLNEKYKKYFSGGAEAK